MNFDDQSRLAELTVSKLVVEHPHLLNFVQENDLTFTDAKAIVWEACRMFTEGYTRDGWFARDDVKERLSGCVKNGEVSHIHHWIEVDPEDFPDQLSELRRQRWRRSLKAICNVLQRKAEAEDPYTALEWLEETVGKLRRHVNEAPHPAGADLDCVDKLRQARQPNQEAGGDAAGRVQVVI